MDGRHGSDCDRGGGGKGKGCEYVMSEGKAEGGGGRECRWGVKAQAVHHI